MAVEDEYRIVLHGDAVAWIEAQPPGHKRSAVQQWLLGLLADPPDPPAADEDPEQWCFILDTSVAVSYMTVPEYRRIYVDYFEDLDP